VSSTDYRSFFDRELLGVWDLEGRDVTVTIAKVTQGELTNDGKQKSKKPIVHIEKSDKRFACNKTNGKTIATLYGPDTREWVGKRITLYPTTTKFGRDTVDCIRVRNVVPTAKGAPIRNDVPHPNDAPAPAERQPGEE